MAAGFVEDHAAKAVVDHHGHDARRALRRVEHGAGRLRRFFRAGGRINFGVKNFKALHRAGRDAAGLVFRAVGCNRRHHEAGVDAGIVGE